MTAEDGLSTKGSTGKLVLNILGSIALFERNLMLERTRAGLAAAKSKGRIGGRRRKMGPAEVTRARQMLSKGELNADDVASMLRVSRRTLFRELRAARDREAIFREVRAARNAVQIPGKRGKVLGRPNLVHNAGGCEGAGS
jgi:DNA invertase Pin-like site-specific DNA recombinase